MFASGLLFGDLLATTNFPALNATALRARRDLPRRSRRRLRADRVYGPIACVQAGGGHVRLPVPGLRPRLHDGGGGTRRVTPAPGEPYPHPWPTRARMRVLMHLLSPNSSPRLPRRDGRGGFPSTDSLSVRKSIPSCGEPTSACLAGRSSAAGAPAGVEWCRYRGESRSEVCRRAIIRADRCEVWWRRCGVWCVCGGGAIVCAARGWRGNAFAAANSEIARPPTLVAARTATAVQAVAVEAMR